jgi:hypothetical protein
VRWLARGSFGIDRMAPVIDTPRAFIYGRTETSGCGIDRACHRRGRRSTPRVVALRALEPR